MRAGTVTLRVHDRLVGIRVDTDATRHLLAERFGPWLDEQDVEWAFDLALDPGAPSVGDEPDQARRGPIPLPQLRLGQRVIARSRRPDDVIDALAALLGGFEAARREPDLGWCGMRLFTRGDVAILLDVLTPSLLGDRTLARAGFVEHPAWAVAVKRTADGAPVVELPAPFGLSVTDTSEYCQYSLAGIVSPDGPIDGLSRDPESHAATLVRLATRQTSAEWFTIVNDLLERGQIVTADRQLSGLRTSIEALVALA